jgi:hypothetical protein
MDRSCIVSIGHWLPIVTRCPVNKLPDLIYVRVDFVDTFAELYEVRRKVRKLVAWKCMFMEEVAREVLDAFPAAQQVTVALAFNRHIVTLRNF